MTVSFRTIAECPDVQPYAECCGIDLSKELTRTDIEFIRCGLLKHELLLFRNQNALTPEKEVVFNKSFGWHDPNQTGYLFGFGAPGTEHKVSGGAQLPECPEVSVLGNVMLENYYGIKETQLIPVLGYTFSGWHADGLHDMHRGLPILTTMYNPMKWQTRGGGQTLFTSGVKALERLETDLIDELRECVVAYMRSPNDEYPDESRRINSGPSYMTDDGTRRVGFGADPHDASAGLRDFTLTHEHAIGGGRHPCIYRHPVTGQESLYVSPCKSVYLLDATSGEVRHDIEETVELLSKALWPSAKTGVRYEHHWKEGDFVAWLNTLTLHSATDPVNIDGSRLMHRVRLSTPIAEECC